MSLLIVALLSIASCIILNAVCYAVDILLIELLSIWSFRRPINSSQAMYVYGISDTLVPLILASSISFILFYESTFLYGLYAFATALPVISYRKIKSNYFYYIASKKLAGMYDEGVLNHVRWGYIKSVQLLFPITGILYLLSFTVIYFAIKSENEFREINEADNCEPAGALTFDCGDITRRLY